MESEAAPERPRGVAPIKPEYILDDAAVEFIDDDSAEAGTNPTASAATGDARDADGEPAAKRQRLSGAEKKRLAREAQKANKGANKNRRFAKVRDEVDVCWRVAAGEECPNGTQCRFSHDMTAYLKDRPQDLPWSTGSYTLSSEPPFIPSYEPRLSELNPSVDFNTVCPNYASSGQCKHGFKCRFLGGHVKEVPETTGKGASLELLKDEEVQAAKAAETTELNPVGGDTLKLLSKRKYPTPITDAYLKEIEGGPNNEVKKPEVVDADVDVDIVVDEPAQAKSVPEVDMSSMDTPDLQVRPSEKKRLNWKGKTYLAPLTTVGNLPFRRLCSNLGAEITCSEMALGTSILSASREEWSLVRRHPSESIFGVQLAGSKPAVLGKTAEVLASEFGRGGRSEGLGGIDFVDVNCGCPIDLIFKAGAGSALLDAPGKLGKIVIGMNRALGDIPVTIKIRTGVKDNKNTAHKLMPRLGSWGVSALTLHGRSRQQRYTKLADWNYIKECTETLRAQTTDEDLPPIPIFGGGDIYSAQAYYEAIDQTGVDGIMIGRGALIKPWIFTEIKEKREWDISSRERLEMMRQYAEFGLNHWGSDTIGVNTTRRYLCEALSFTHRYVPIGLLEVLPGRINDRPPAYRGRDELETLLASPSSQDWVKISEMFLGPAPESFNFIPKHKSNAVEANG